MGRNTVTQQLDNEISALRAMPYLFSEANWNVYDGDAIARLYRETQNEVLVDIPGDNFKLAQFQVVNGCQTSHVLFNNRINITDDMYLTVKLVETSDVDLSGQVISTTNSQSQVTKEAFATIRPYHRVVEDFFNAMRSLGYSYYYERRPHQFDDRHDILSQFIISAPVLIKSFVSTVLEEPHKVHYYYGTLLSDYSKNRSSELFSEEDYPGLYFAAQHITFRARGAAFRDKDLKEWGFHLALLIKRALAPELRRGMALTDKKFLDLLKRIDDNFDSAFAIAAEFLRGARLLPNENRAGSITNQLLVDFSRQIAGSKFSPKSQQKQFSTDFQLKDGRYVGTLDRVDVPKRKAVVQYGPFKIEGDASDSELLALPAGARVVFTASTGRVTVAVPTFEK